MGAAEALEKKQIVEAEAVAAAAAAAAAAAIPAGPSKRDLEKVRKAANERWNVADKALRAAKIQASIKRIPLPTDRASQHTHHYNLNLNPKYQPKCHPRSNHQHINQLTHPTNQHSPKYLPHRPQTTAATWTAMEGNLLHMCTAIAHRPMCDCGCPKPLAICTALPGGRH
jgi:hypothetical protein